MKKWLFGLITSLVVLMGWGPAAPVQAADNFQFDLHSTYLVGEPGQTTVEHELNITNLTPTLYAKQYALKITSGTAIRNVRVTSDDQPLTPNVVTTDNLTSIGLTFPDKLVGEGKVRRLRIRYDQTGSSIISGKVLEMYVPPLGTDQPYDTYTVTLLTPVSYGQPVRVTPEPTSTDQNETYVITQFQQVGKTGIAALFGSEQIFNVTLRYNLENTTEGPGLLQIALPPDTPYQRVHYTELDPQPQKLETDDDGNWIATYQLPASSETIVYATLQTRLRLEPDPHIPAPVPNDSWFKPQTFWESDQSEITSLASTATTPRAIYDLVVNTLTYNVDLASGTPSRFGAVGALLNPTKATCQEFTDLFVALARSNQIPARRIAGYAHTENSSLRPLSLLEDILHSWPEYYDQTKQAWIQVDPTWASTTGGVNYFDQFDLNHIVFAFNGQSSTTPYPAGSYKLTNQNTKDVAVEFGTSFPDLPPKLQVTVSPHRLWGIAVPGWNDLTIINETGLAWYDLEFSAQAQSNSGQVELRQPQVKQILPFQTHTISLLAFGNGGWGASNQPIQVTMQGSGNSDAQLTQTVYVNFGPSFASYLTEPAFLIGLAIGAGGLALTAGGILVSRRK